MEYKSFRIGDLFELKSNPQLNKESFNFTSAGYPYFTRTEFNNGILGYVDYLDEEHKIKGNSLAVGMIEMRFHYMECDFYSGQFTKTAFPKFSNFNRRIALYFITLLNKYQSEFQSTLIRNFERVFTNLEILLPVTLSNEINFAYIENYVWELESVRIRELQAYLEAAGLFTSDNKQSLSEYGTGKVNHKIKYEAFRIGDLFEAQNGDFDVQQKHINGSGTFVVSSGEANLGVIGKSDVKAKLFSAGTITIDMFGYAYYREFEYKMVTHGRVLSLSLNNGEEISREVGLYFTTCFGFFKKIFSYDNVTNWSKIKDIEISLPVTASGKIDFKYITAHIHKLETLRVRELKAYLEAEGYLPPTITSEV